MHEFLNKFAASMAIAITGVLCTSAAAAAADQFGSVSSWSGLNAANAVSTVSKVGDGAMSFVWHTPFETHPAQKRVAEFLEQTVAMAAVNANQSIQAFYDPTKGMVFRIDLGTADRSAVMAAITDSTWQIDAGQYSDWIEARAAQPTGTIGDFTDDDLPWWGAGTTDGEGTALIREAIGAVDAEAPAVAGGLAIGDPGAFTDQYLIADGQPTIGNFGNDTTILAEIKPNVGPAHGMMATVDIVWHNEAMVKYADIKPNVGPMQYVSHPGR
jgi:hypothetical protein